MIALCVTLLIIPDITPLLAVIILIYWKHKKYDEKSIRFSFIVNQHFLFVSILISSLYIYANATINYVEIIKILLTKL